MTRFAPLLDKLSGELAHVPQPQKYRILRELSDDLDDFYQYYCERGYDDDEAARLAELKVTPDAATLRLLAELNRSPVTSFMRRFTTTGQRRIEAAIWVVLACSLGIPLAMPQVSLYAEGVQNPYFWPVAMCAALVVAAAAYQTHTLYITRDHAPGNLDRFMTLIPFAGMQGILWGLIGFFTEVRNISQNIAAGQPSMGVFDSMLKTGLALLISGSLTAVAAGLVWLALSVKTVSIREHEKAFILDKRKD